MCRYSCLSLDSLAFCPTVALGLFSFVVKSNDLLRILVLSLFFRLLSGEELPRNDCFLVDLLLIFCETGRGSIRNILGQEQERIVLIITQAHVRDR
jgi:hypothetical protein